MIFANLCVFAAAASLILAAISDVRAFRIPNIFPLILILAFVGARLVTGFSSDDWGHLLHFAIALAAGMFLFRIGWIGGGDAKLYAGAAIWFAGIDAAFLIFATGMAGLVLAIVYFTTRKMRHGNNPERKKESRIPYGLAIAAGALAMGAQVGINALV